MLIQVFCHNSDIAPLTVFGFYADPLVIFGAATFLFITAVTVTLASLGVGMAFEARGFRAFTALLIATRICSGGQNKEHLHFNKTVSKSSSDRTRTPTAQVQLKKNKQTKIMKPSSTFPINIFLCRFFNKRFKEVL